MKVLMTGVDKNRFGGMWTVANNYISDEKFNKEVELIYVATSTNGSIIKRFFLMIYAFIRICFLLSKEKIDIIHIHMAEKGSTFRAKTIVKIAKHFGVRIIIHLHAGPFMDWYSTLKTAKQKSIKKMFSQIDCLLVLGEYWKGSLLPLIDEHKIKVLYNGGHMPNKNNYKTDNKYITYMGVLKKEKGIFDLIDAIKLIDNQLDKRIIVKLCGIDLAGNVQEYINNNHLENRIDLVGWVDENQREIIYNNTLLNVLPSYFEALSMTVIESMANGIPIIATDISTMYEVLGDKELLVKVGDYKALSKKIINLINDKEKLLLISKNLYKRAHDSFDVNTNIRNTLSIYKELLQKNNKR